MWGNLRNSVVYKIDFSHFHFRKASKLCHQRNHSIKHKNHVEIVLTMAILKESINWDIGFNCPAVFALAHPGFSLAVEHKHVKVPLV